MGRNVFFALLPFLAVTVATNYCSKELCDPFKHHIACGHDEEFAESCPEDARIIDLAPHNRTILMMHNERRNFVAGGNLKGYKPAARMATMQWDDELCALAALNAKQCEMMHDSCRNTDTFRYVGQNLAIHTYMGYVLEDNGLIQSSIDMWFDEHRDCNMNIIDRYPEFANGDPKVGHFTMMVIDRNTRVGCAASRYSTGVWQHFLFVCNYASTNLIGKPTYHTSNIPALGCRSGRNPDYQNLCSIAELDYLYN